MAFNEDLSVFFNPNEHGVTATYKGSVSINGIMNNAFKAVNGVESLRPTFQCIESEVSGVRHGDTLLISGITYKVQGIEPDGMGLITLILEEQ